MKILTLIVFGMLSLTTMGSCYADFCGELKRFMAAADNDFAGVKGELVDSIDGAEYYSSNISMPPLHSCKVINGNDTGWFGSCTNGIGKNKQSVNLGQATQLVPSCNLRVRQVIQSGLDSTFYEVITDQEKLVRVSLSVYPRSGSASIHVKKMR